MEEKELWMKKLKEKLGEHSEPLPASSWEQLEKELIPPVKRKIPFYPRWMIGAAAVVLLALVSSLALYFLGSPAADEIRQTQTPVLATVPDVLPIVQEPDEKAKTIEQVRRSVSKDRIARAEQSSLKPESNVVTQDQAATTEGNANAHKQQEAEPPTKETAEVQGQQRDSERTPPKTHRPSSKDKLHIPVGKAPSKKGTWSVGLSVGNSGGSSSDLALKDMPMYMYRVNMTSVSNGLLNIPSDETLLFEDGVPYLRQANKVVDMKHQQPISFGLSVRKSLGSGFSVETGLTYTLLSSDGISVESGQQIEQKLHYLGIPLKANWNFLDKKLFTLYLSGGGMIEKCVYGKLGSEKQTVKPLQFSLFGGVGAQINATKRVGFYIEPGVAYYFKDGSDVQTIRKENPFNFNLQAGLRLTY